MNDRDLERLLPLLEDLPSDVPFTSRTARDLGVEWRALRALVAAGLLLHPVRDVYSPVGLADDLEHRLAVLRLVVPPDCVVTDSTAGWLWGAQMILAPGDHLVTPRVSVYAPPGRRLRIGLSDSGERMLAARDVCEVGGVLVTSALRTACDLGRLLHRDRAMAALDALTALRVFTPEEVALEVERFKGYRGVVQLRCLVALVDPGAQSPPESILRLRWHDVGLPWPRCQVRVDGPDGSYYLDIGLESRKLAAEYDGEEWHGPDRQQHDAARREWIRERGEWVIVVVRRDNLFGRQQDAEQLLREGNRQALLHQVTRADRGGTSSFHGECSLRSHSRHKLPRNAADPSQSL